MRPPDCASCRSVFCAQRFVVPAHRWTEMDVARVVASSTDVPKNADGTPARRVPLFVFRDYPGWKKTDYYTEYPHCEAFVDLPRGWVPGPLRVPAGRSVLFVSPTHGHIAAAISRWDARCCWSRPLPVTSPNIGGLSALQKSDAGKMYHSGIMLILKALGITSVPGVPKNKQQAKRVVEFADRVIKMMRLQPEWCAVARLCVFVCGTSQRLPGRLELYRIERRFFNARFADVVSLIESHNALGLDRVMALIAPATRLGLPGADPRNREAWVPPSLEPVRNLCCSRAPIFYGGCLGFWFRYFGRWVLGPRGFVRSYGLCP